jgi:anti-anti-sigma factor
MEVTRTVKGDVVELAVDGRLDGYWADHLDSALADAVRGGYRRVRLDLAKVTFLSSAGIAVMMKYYKQLTAIEGSLRVLNPAPTVQNVLDITRLSPLLIKEPGDLTIRPTKAGRFLERPGALFQVVDLEPGATLTCRAVGSEAPLATGGFAEEDCRSLGSLSPLFAVGVGAFGASFAECRARFGEMLSVAGATAYQPADGTNVPDYLVASGPLAADVRVLYCLACEGRWRRLARFEAARPEEPIGLSRVLESCVEIAESPAVGVVAVAETAGLIGAALRRSPALGDGAADFFAHPGIRSRLGFTAERAFLRTVTIVAGVVVRGDDAAIPQLRPLGTSRLRGHVHAVAFTFRPLGDGLLDFKATVAGLFEAEHPQGVLHLLVDDRGAAGVGESEFFRGACWLGPLRLQS